MNTQLPLPEQEPSEQKTKLSEVARNPAAYVLMMVMGLVGYFSRGLGDAQGARAEEANRRADQCEIRLTNERAQKDEIMQQLLIKQGTIDAVTVIADSARPSAPAKSKK